MTAQRYVILTRVSTDHQGIRKNLKHLSSEERQSKLQEEIGLGLQSQMDACLRYVEQQGGELVDTFQEIVSGGAKEKITINQSITMAHILRHRQELKRAVELCQKENAILVVKELSRLTRSSFVIEWIIAARIQFVCADSPNDDPMMLRIKTIINENELKRISERTRAALKVKKDKGEPLGCHTHKQTALYNNQAGAMANAHRARTNENNQRALSLAKMWLKEEQLGYREMAKKLNEMGYKTSTDSKWHTGSVYRLLKRDMKNNRDRMLAIELAELREKMGIEE